jgi:hypothetical protein
MLGYRGPAQNKNGPVGGEAAWDRHFRQRMGIGAADTRKIPPCCNTIVSPNSPRLCSCAANLQRYQQRIGQEG